MPFPQNVQYGIVQRSATERERERRRFVTGVGKVFCYASRNFIDEKGFVHAVQLQRYVLLGVVVAKPHSGGMLRWQHELCDQNVGIMMLTSLSRTIAPSLRTFPALSRSGLALQKTMTGFKQVCTQKDR